MQEKTGVDFLALMTNNDLAGAQKAALAAGVAADLVMSKGCRPTPPFESLSDE